MDSNGASYGRDVRLKSFDNLLEALTYIQENYWYERIDASGERVGYED